MLETDPEFQLVLADVDLEKVDVSELPAARGIYLWRLSGDLSLVVYVGRTTSLQRRIREYRNPFQPGVVNDFKMRHFQRWARKHYPDCTLDLYFYQFEGMDLNVLETNMIRRHNPLINNLASVTHDELLEAHWRYYESRFDKTLQARKRATAKAGSVKVTLPNNHAWEKPALRVSKSQRKDIGSLRAREAFTKAGRFKAGTNRDIIFQLLTRDGGATAAECKAACNPARRSSIMSDVHDVVFYTGRKLVHLADGRLVLQS
jgi:hypothetical protein